MTRPATAFQLYALNKLKALTHLAQNEPDGIISYQAAYDHLAQAHANGQWTPGRRKPRTPRTPIENPVDQADYARSP